MTAAECPAPRRWSGVQLPEDPGEEELARNWTLSEADKREAAQCRGDENRRRFALQLCVLRRYGRLLEGGETAPVRIANHLGAQMELPPVLFAAGGLRPVTEKQYADRVRRYNACVLSQLLEYAERKKDFALADRIKSISPVSWKHVNFYGEYNFRDPGEIVDLDQMVSRLAALEWNSADSKQPN